MPKYNVLFLFSDQHNESMMGCSSNEIIDTPNIDKLAKEGVRFTNAYCQNPLCVPSRSVLMTGKYCKNLGIYENRHILQSNCQTMPRVFKDNGYRTCLIGKSHFNGEQYQGYAQRPYGDVYGQAHQPDPKRLPKFGINGLGDLLENTGPSEIPLAMTQTEICVSETVKWLQLHQGQNAEQPFFLSVNLDKPHFPIRPPAKYYEKYIGKVAVPDFPENYIYNQAVPFVTEAVRVNGAINHYGKNRELQNQALAAYYGCIEWIDDAIGRIVDALDYLGLKENTIVIYSSDHGEMAGDKGAWQKTVFFDASAKVPMIFRLPKSIAADTISYDLVGLIDIFPTLCEMTDIKLPGDLDGESFASVLTDGKAYKREYVISESVVLKVPEHAGCMIRNKEFKYCYYLDGHNELYDMINDKDEYNNLSGQEKYKQIEDEFIAKVEEFWQPEDQIKRYSETPMMTGEKHFYEFSNQFITADGSIVDAKP